MRLPSVVLAADWSKNDEKRWMVLAELQADRRYAVGSPKPVGDVDTLVSRLRDVLPSGGTGLIGFDFPIGLPRAYATAVGLHTWRQALSVFGALGWERFYEIGDRPSLWQPFYPKTASKPGHTVRRLTEALGVADIEALLRRCERATKDRSPANCVFFTLGAKQVGPAAIVGWRDVLAPAGNSVRFWPFDGALSDLLGTPGIVLCEIYPREAYGHLGLLSVSGRRFSKGNREHRRAVAERLLDANPNVRFSDGARRLAEWGFMSDDDFDATVGLLSMLQVVTGRRPSGEPKDDPAVTTIEGWILGQQAENTAEGEGGG